MENSSIAIQKNAGDNAAFPGQNERADDAANTAKEVFSVANLTSKELTALEDQIGCEATLVKKYEAMACLCPDEKVRRDLQTIAGKHRAHFNTLVTFLN